MSIAEQKTTAAQLIERMRNPQLPEEDLRKSMKQFLVSYANHIFVRLPEKKQKAAALAAYAAIDAQPKLLRCDPMSLIKAVSDAAIYDLTIGGVLSHAHLIPYGREAKLQIGYKGLIELCRRSGQVKDITVEDVRAGDHFDVTFGDDPKIEHKPAFDAQRAGRPITHVYAVIRLVDGGTVRRVFSAGEIDANKEKYYLSPWHTAWLPMAKKTVLRAMINGGLVPIATEYRTALDHDVDVETTVEQVALPTLTSILPEEQPSQQVQTIETATTTEKAAGDFESYLRALEAAELKTDAAKVYDAFFGPDSTSQWTPEQHTLAAELRDKRVEQIGASRGGKKS